MGDIRSYRDLKVWQDAMPLAEECYGYTGAFPREELYGLTTQIRRQATAIPAAIAEGYGRQNSTAYVSFLHNAQGSLKELETHVLLSQRLGFGDKGLAQNVLDRCDEIGRMLFSLARAVRATGDR